MNNAPKELKVQVLQYIQDNPGIGRKKVADHFNISHLTVRAWKAGKWPEARKNRLAARQKEKIRKHKFILVQFLGGQCSECGYRDCYAALEFHHKDPSTKIGRGVSDVLSGKFETALEEAKKCILLCGNCHQALHEKENDLSAAQTAVIGDGVKAGAVATTSPA